MFQAQESKTFYHGNILVSQGTLSIIDFSKFILLKIHLSNNFYFQEQPAEPELTSTEPETEENKPKNPSIEPKSEEEKPKLISEEPETEEICNATKVIRLYRRKTLKNIKKFFISKQVKVLHNVSLV